MADRAGAGITRLVASIGPPGHVPTGLTESDTAAMAAEMAMCCFEAGHPTEPYRTSPFNWAFPGVPVDVLDRARYLVFQKWGLVDA